MPTQTKLEVEVVEVSPYLDLAGVRVNLSELPLEEGKVYKPSDIVFMINAMIRGLGETEEIGLQDVLGEIWDVLSACWWIIWADDGGGYEVKEAIASGEVIVMVERKDGRGGVFSVPESQKEQHYPSDDGWEVIRRIKVVEGE